MRYPLVRERSISRLCSQATTRSLLTRKVLGKQWPDIVVSVASTLVNVPLEVGLAGETVTVTARRSSTLQPNLTNVINTRQVVDLPLGGRNPVDLAGLQAGIAVVQLTYAVHR